MAVYRNADYQTRVWPSIQRPDGRTLELEAGEEAELELPDDFADRHLLAGQARPTRKARPTKKDGGDAAQTDDGGDVGSTDGAVATPQES